MVFVTLVVVLSFTSLTKAYIFECLDGCQCDTNDEAIHCHNGQRTTLFLPEKRLRGFTVIGITNNRVRSLPTTAELREKFPDLRAIDVEKNADFDCDSLKNYRSIVVYSDCPGNERPTMIRGQRLPDIEEPSSSCDLACQVKKHYNTLHEYLRGLWEDLKTKYNEIDKEKIIADIQEFLRKIADKIRSLRN